MLYMKNNKKKKLSLLILSAVPVQIINKISVNITIYRI